MGVKEFAGLCSREKLADEQDLTLNARLLVVEMATLDGSDCFDPAEGCFCLSQRPKALTASKLPLHDRVIALDEVVAPLFVEMPDTVEMRVVAVD